MKPLLCPSKIRLPNPRTPLPAYMTLPEAAACTGSPVAPAMSMPLVLELKPWIILPVAGHDQLISAASLARTVLVGSTGLTGVTGTGVATAEGAGPDEFRRST